MDLVKLGVGIDGTKAQTGERVVNRSLANIKREAGTATSSVGKLNKSFMSFRATALTLVSGYGLAKMTGSLISIASQSDTLKAKLSYATDGVRDLGETWAWVQKLGRTPPFDEEQIASAFITLKNAGVRNAKEAVEAIGNASAGIGTSIETLSSAVISQTAITLRRLGIEIDKTGDTAKILFKNVEYETENTSQAVRDKLIEILGTSFEGAMAKTTDNIKGYYENMKGNIVQTIRDLATGGTEAMGGFKVAMKDMVTQWNEWLESDQYKVWVDEWSGKLRSGFNTVGTALEYAGKGFSWIIDNRQALLGTLISWKIATMGLKMAFAGEAVASGALALGASAGLAGAISSVIAVLGPAIAVGGAIALAVIVLDKLTDAVGDNAEGWKALRNEIEQTAISQETYNKYQLEHNGILGGPVSPGTDGGMSYAQALAEERKRFEKMNVSPVEKATEPDLFDMGIGTGVSLGSSSFSEVGDERVVKSLSTLKEWTEEEIRVANYAKAMKISIAEATDKIASAQEIADRASTSMGNWDIANMKLISDYSDLGGVATIALERIKDKVTEVDDTQKQWIQNFKDGITDVIMAGGGLTDMISGIGDQIAKMWLNQMLWGSSAGGGLLSFLIPGRASGGSVSANSPYMVGEEGPELFVPKTSGSIIPNGQAVAGSSESTVVHMSINAIDAKGVMDFFTKNKGQVLGIVQENMSRGGSLMKTVRRGVK